LYYHIQEISSPPYREVAVMEILILKGCVTFFLS
jgi:hypothetical protein